VNNHESEKVTELKLYTFKAQKLQALPCHKEFAVEMLAMTGAFWTVIFSYDSTFHLCGVVN
jgi:hypothetical protein